MKYLKFKEIAKEIRKSNMKMRHIEILYKSPGALFSLGAIPRMLSALT